MNVNIPKRRFKGFSEDWKQRKLKDITEKISERNTDNHYQNVFTNSALHGIINQTDYFDRNIANSTNLTNYYVVQKDNFIYNPRISSNAPYGPINRNKLNQVGVMSPLYLVFENRLASHDFLEYYFFSSKWYRYMLKVGNTGARSDRYAIKNKDFFNMPIFIPEYNEQCKVGNILKVLNKTITLHKRKFEKLKQLQKSYLNESILSEPKCVPKRRFKGFSEDWEQRELGEIANIIPGGTPKTTVKDYWWPKEIPWMSSGEINKRIVEKTDDMISKNGFENSSAKLIKEKSVLIALAGQGKTRGLVAVNEVPLTTNQSIAAFELEANITNYKFLFYTLDRQYMRLRHISSGDGTRGGLNKNLLESYKSHFPVLEEQNHISEFISKIENLITLHKRKFEKLKQLQKSYLNESILSEPKCVPKRRFKGFSEDWEQYQVGKISKSFSGGTPRSSESDFYHGNIPFIRSGEINSTTTEIFITEEGLSSSSAKIVEKGNLLYAMYGATSGEVAISKITGAINQAILAIILNENHNKMFLYYYLSNNKNRILHKYLQGGQGNLSANIIKNINVKIPQNPRESIKISEFISSIDNMITLHKHKHNAIKKLQKIYLQNNLKDETYA